MIVILWLVCANIWVTSAAPSVIDVKVGSDVTLEPQYTGDPSEINWKINSNKLVDMEVKPQVEIKFYRLQDRATISHTDGSLTIRSLTIEDSGVYKAEALVNNIIQETEINLTVSEPTVTTPQNRSGPPSTRTNEQPNVKQGWSGLSAGFIAGVVIGGILLVVVAVAAIVLYKKCQGRHSIPAPIPFQKRNDELMYVR